jgi:hypothetical protein
MHRAERIDFGFQLGAAELFGKLLVATDTTPTQTVRILLKRIDISWLCSML